MSSPERQYIYIQIIPNVTEDPHEERLECRPLFWGWGGGSRGDGCEVWPHDIKI